MARSAYGSHQDEQHFNNKSTAKWRLMKWSTFLGVYLLNLLTPIPWIWGNLSVYTSSYYEMRGLSSSDVQAPWFTCVFYIAWSFGILVCERLLKVAKKRMTMLIGLLFSNGGILLSYVSVQHSPHLLTLTLGLMTGIGCGLIYCIEQLYMMEWTDKYVGLAIASIQSLLTLATVSSNVMVTLYINPDNLQPDRFNGHVNYFSQEDIIARVPAFFLLLGSVNVLLNGIGFCLVRDRPSYSDSMPLDWNETYDPSISRDECINGEIVASDPCIQETQRRMSQKGSAEISLEKAKSNISVDNCLSPRQALKTSAFWILALTNMATDISYINMTTYYKVFGSLYIKDDHFLAIIGMLTCVSVSVVVFACGMFSDKLGFKTTAINACGLMTIIISFYFFTPLINRWLFLVFTLLSCGLEFGVYNLVVIGILRIFGFKHFTTIYGMVACSALLANLLVPPVTKFLIVHCGWFDMYLMLAFINFFALLFIVIGLPSI